MARNDNTRLTLMLIAGLMVVGVAMVITVFLATQRPVVIKMPEPVAGPTGATSSTTAGNGGGAATGAAQTEPVIPEIPVVRTQSAPTTEDPLDPAWDRITPIEVPLQAQQTSEPMLAEMTIKQILVQAVRDESRYVWRLSWEQTEPSQSSNVGEFSDAVAIQFPMKDGAPYTMGGPDMPVTMLYWKALWQKDIDDGFQDVKSVYPNAWDDLYWFAKGTGPQPLPAAFENETSHQWLIGRSAGNPMSDEFRRQPLEELTAQGFGSSTHVADSPSTARGVWSEGRWTVVIDRPNNSSDPLIARFDANPSQQLIAIAVWDGQAQNRGARKQITNWLPMRINQ